MQNEIELEGVGDVDERSDEWYASPDHNMRSNARTSTISTITSETVAEEIPSKIKELFERFVKNRLVNEISLGLITQKLYNVYLSESHVDVLLKKNNLSRFDILSLNKFKALCLRSDNVPRA